MVAEQYSGPATIEHPPTPRVEKEEHYYRAAHTKLLDLGLVPHLLTSSVVRSLLAVCEQYKDAVDPAAILPTVDWRSTSSTLATAGSHGASPSDPGTSNAAEVALSRLLTAGSSVGAGPRGRHYRPQDAESQPQTSSPPGRGLGESVLIAIAVTITVVLVGGSLIAIHTQSQGYRTSTTAGYAALADRVGLASTRTGSELSTLMAGAPTLTNSAFPETARGDPRAGSRRRRPGDGRSRRSRRRTCSRPLPEGGLGPRFTRVMDPAGHRPPPPCGRRSTGCSACSRCPSPVRSTPPTHRRPRPRRSPPSRPPPRWTAEGRAFEQSDDLFRALQASATRPAPAGPSAPFGLGSATGRHRAARQRGPRRHGRRPGLLAGAGGLPPSRGHRRRALPPAVPTGAVGTASTDCIAPAVDGPGRNADGSAPDADDHRAGHGDQLRERARVRCHGHGDGHPRRRPGSVRHRRRADGAVAARRRWTWPRGRRPHRTWRRCRWPTGTPTRSRSPSRSRRARPTRPARPSNSSSRSRPEPVGGPPGWSATAGQHLRSGPDDEEEPNGG